MLGLTPETIIMLISTIFSYWAKINAQKTQNMQDLLEATIKQRTNDSELMDAAAKRSSPFLRKVLGTFVIGVAFGGILLAPIWDVPMTLVEHVPQNSILWGLIKFGTGVQIIQADGIVYPLWVRESVMAVIGFVFGSGFSKTTR